MSFYPGPVQQKVFDMVKDGLTDEEIFVKFPKEKGYQTKRRIRRARERLHGMIYEMSIPKGPLKVSYIRRDGQIMYEVRHGHIIGERSLKAFGYNAMGER